MSDIIKAGHTKAWPVFSVKKSLVVENDCKAALKQIEEKNYLRIKKY